jgi:hypothetical protein
VIVHPGQNQLLGWVIMESFSGKVKVNILSAFTSDIKIELSLNPHLLSTSTISIKNSLLSSHGHFSGI